VGHTGKDVGVSVNHGLVVAEENRVLDRPHVVDLAMGTEDRVGQILEILVAVGGVLLLQPF
jgi:hypothetical protein